MRRNLILGGALLAGLGLIYWIAHRAGLLDLMIDTTAFRDWIVSHGWHGPVAVVAAMTFAIVFSPLPSAPIALAAGAAYGHSWGTLYVLVGAELGAIIAFVLARLLGRDALRRWFGDKVDTGWLGSQRSLMAIVFVSRLMPFVSFDLISYAAGLSAIAFWRFAVATFAGVAPASFLLAHFGDEMASGEAGRVGFTVLLLGGVTLIPLVVAYFRRR